MHTISLITGGARSGKSAFALALASRAYRKKAFIATAVPFDEEMKERIRNHQKEREGAFRTVEEPLHLAEAVMNLPRDVEVALVDCLTVWPNHWEAWAGWRSLRFSSASVGEEKTRREPGISERNRP